MSESPPSIYILQHSESPWADYGDILAHGMCNWPPDAPLELERTGPFIPPISFPFGRIVVSDEFRRQLEGSGLSGMTFRPVIKKRIVRLEWEKWDASRDEPLEYPESGEPEGYILEGKHSEETAAEMGALWEVCLGEHAVIERVGTTIWDQAIFLILASWDGTDLFRVEGVLWHFVSQRAREWLEAAAGPWVSFRQPRVK